MRDRDGLLALAEQLTLEQKAALVQGADFWSTTAVPQIGLGAITMSDGPAGVRGPVWDERAPSLSLPCGSMLAASWDPELAHQYGRTAAGEARRKRVQVVLGPTINLHRSPLGGRNFECLSEDPLLTGALAAAYVRGVQAEGVAACPKHFVANDSETDRFSVDIEADERTLREMYLAPFEAAVRAGAWAVMSSYNSVNGTTMSANPLLTEPLKGEWGFDGLVVSDWTAVRSLDAARSGQDLAMPGPCPAWAGLAAAVLAGMVAEADLDQKVLRILRLADRVGALEGSSGRRRGEPPRQSEAETFARAAAAEGMVLLTNDGTLPLAPGQAGRIAVIGQNARDARIQGGGSATVVPGEVIAPVDAIRSAQAGATVTFRLGALVQQGFAALPKTRILNPLTGGQGLRVSFFDADGQQVFAEDRLSAALVWFGGDAPLRQSAKLVIETEFTPEVDGDHRLGFAGSPAGRVWADETLVLDDEDGAAGHDLGAAFSNPASVGIAVPMRAGRPVRVRAELDLLRSSAPSGALSVDLGVALPGRDPDSLIKEAAQSAAEAEVAIVVVGTTPKVESEGHDREDLKLPGRQDDLVWAVAATGTPTVVVVNAGAPVEMPWRDDVSAIILMYFGGQCLGDALADVLSGAREPGGRLPTTWPQELADAPVSNVHPTGGVLRYGEGIHIGYRAWLKAATRPAFPFGHGLGYTSWAWDSVQRDGDALLVAVRNTGERSGKQVVQVYAERPDSAVDRPVRWLVGWAVVRAQAGESRVAEVAIARRSLAHWDSEWVVEPGVFKLRVGSSVDDLQLAADWTV
ncbi:MAG: glycoside hydrolase family 3 C-terminal domain-containing protein [Bifidobacteriaceae bacterium]|jgi:beta-glucosidase|nr:glycoside hydrolase family 3 C-terminal domain-containing protein [Bifidobacteriaceae bacterium]